MKEVFEFFVGEHFINEAEDGLSVFLIKLLYKPHLLYGRFILHDHFFEHFAVKVDDLVGGHVKELKEFCKSH